MSLARCVKRAHTLVNMRYIAIIAVGTLFAGCKNYTITPDSLRQQLKNATPAEVRMNGPLGETHNYRANNIHMIHCFDKNGQPAELPNGPAIESRITLANGRRKVMYFDRIELRNDTLIGHPSRFISTMEIRIPYSQIVKIEVQNGGKRMSYGY